MSLPAGEMVGLMVDNLGKLIREDQVIIAGLVNDGSDAEFIMIFQTEDGRIEIRGVD